MPDPGSSDPQPTPPTDDVHGTSATARVAAGRTPAERAGDHQAVDRLAANLVPALIRRLTAGGLAEIEVREDGWKVRLRRPLEVIGTGRRTSDRQFRLPIPGAQPGQAASSQLAPRSAAPRPDDPARTTAATSPAVGIFRPLPGVVGRQVHAGDRLGSVDVLGVPQEIVAPADGVVGPLIAEAGDGVEYGQPLIEMRPAVVAAPAGERA